MYYLDKDKLDKLRQQSKIRKSIMWNIQKLNVEINNIRDISISFLDDEKVKTSELSDPTANKAIKIVTEYSGRMDELQNELIRLDKEIEDVGRVLTWLWRNDEISDIEYNVIKHYYIDALTIGEIAIVMSYSTIWIKQLKAKAVEKACNAACANIQAANK